MFKFDSTVFTQIVVLDTDQQTQRFNHMGKSYSLVLLLLDVRGILLVQGPIY